MKLLDFSKKKAGRLLKKAQQRDSEGKVDEAIAIYIEAIACDPENAAVHCNLDLIYKYRGE